MRSIESYAVWKVRSFPRAGGEWSSPPARGFGWVGQALQADSMSFLFLVEATERVAIYLVVRYRATQVVKATKLRGRERHFDSPVVTGRIVYRHGQNRSSPLSSFCQLETNGGFQALPALLFRSLYRPDTVPLSRWGHIVTDGRTRQEHSYTVVEVKTLRSRRLVRLEIGEHRRERLEYRRIRLLATITQQF